MCRVLRTIENKRGHDTHDNRGQSRSIPDKDPGLMAGGNLEFLGRSDAPDVGVPADVGDGEYIHSYVDDGNHQRVQGRGKKNDVATRQSKLHS